MTNSQGKPSDQSKAHRPLQAGEISDLSESHQMTLHRSPRIEGEVQDFLNNSTEYHLTICLTHETLSRRELSLLLEVLCYQVVHYGVNLPMYLCLSELYFRLLGNKRSSKEIREGNIRKTLLVTEVLLKRLKGIAFPLNPKEYLQTSDLTRKLVEPYLMTSRTYGSRYKTWRPEKFFVVRIVPVDIQLLERRKISEPYSSYCKGYGESHPSAHSKKTNPSPDLDGDGSNFLTSEEDFLFQRCTDPIHLLSECLLIKYKSQFQEDL